MQNSSHSFYQTLVKAFETYAEEGMDAFACDSGEAPVLSHLCLKFSSMAAYENAVTFAEELGTVVKKEFKGKEVSWCKLDEPLAKEDLTLEWVEMVQPLEPQSDDAVTAIGFYVPDLEEVSKVSSQDDVMTFRYQPFHAETLAA